ncbi:VanZ family protein [Bacillus spongiae]|uniref:VanZ family protein n=1 Tax=Bacillus spongiae TaxID=2683610 RepID=A0ABU8HKD8_9BACI
MFLYVEFITLFAPWLLYRIILFLVKKEFSLRTELINGFFYFSLIFIYYLTIAPFPFIFYEKEYYFALMNLIPFQSIYGSLSHDYFMVPLRNIGGNILLFVPLGFIIPLRFKLSKLSKVLFVGFSVSLTVEIIQFLWLPGRSPDVDDLILNTLGALIGFLIFNSLVMLYEKFKRPLSELLVWNKV